MISIYCDLDGVLSNLRKKVHDVSNGKWTRETDHIFWPYVKQNHPYFFSELELLPDAHKLWEFIKPRDPVVLTALVNPIKNFEWVGSVVRQKITWVHDRFGKHVPVIVCRKLHKQDYAHSGAVLIDDTEENIIQFRRAGGIGVLHLNAEQTVQELKKILGEG